jgi:SSS family solute:Na+ symporter
VVGRILVVVLAVTCRRGAQLRQRSCGTAFTIIQKRGFIPRDYSFAFGLIVRRRPRIAGAAALITSIVATIFAKYVPGVSSSIMAICLALCVGVMTVLTLIKPLPAPIEFKPQSNLNLASSRGALVGGIAVVLLTLVLYVIFSPLVLAK